MPSELDPAFANYMPPRRRETPTEGMKRIELEMRDRPDLNPGRIATGAGRTMEGYNASIGTQGPVGGGVVVAADPVTGQPVMVGGKAQAGPLSYQYNKPTFKGAPASQQIGVGGQPFDADTYFGVTAQQSPGQGRTYGANVSQSGEDGGWSAYGGYNPTTKGVNVGGSYTANFSDGGRAVVGHTTAAGEPISLEEHKGEIRHRQDSGNSRMAADYGYIDTSKPDHDGMKTDAFVGPHRDSKKVFVVNQQHPHTGKFNEHKVLLGYKDRAHALRDYVHSFSDGLGHKRIHSVVEMGTHELKDWLKKDHTAPLRKAEGGPVHMEGGGDLPPRTLTIRRSEVPKAAEAQDGALRDEDTYGPTNLEERKARIQEMTTPTDYPGDKLEAPQGYITPATAVEWKLGDAGPYAVDAEGKTLPLIKQPGVLPLYRDPTVDSIRPAMPALVDIAGNVMGAPAGITAARTIQAAAAGERPLANVVSAMGAGEKATAQVVKGAEGAESTSDLAAKAKEVFGKTRDIREAGYVMPDGSMLDFTGRHQVTNDYARVGDFNRPVEGKRDWMAGERNVDHRDVSDLIDAPQGISGTDAMTQFMDQTNAIRNKPGIGFESVETPTDQQLKALVGGHNKSYRGEPMMVELSDRATGDVIASTEFEKPSVEVVKKWFEDNAPNKSEPKSGTDQPKNFPPNSPEYAENLAKFMEGSSVPQRVYHASRQDFPQFDTGMSEFGSHFGTVDQANAMSRSELLPDFFPSKHSGTQTYPVHVNIKNPIRLNDAGKFDPNEVITQLIDKGILSWDDYNPIMKLPKQEASLALQKILKDRGHDGVVYLNKREGVKDLRSTHFGLPDAEFKKVHPEAQDSYIIFDPNQVKSAIGNRGTFDPARPHINEAEGGPIEVPAQGGPVTPASATQQVANVAQDLASIAHKDHLDQRHLAYLLKVASGMYMPADRAMQYAQQIMTGDVSGLVQRFRNYRGSIVTFARLNQMMGGKHKFMGSEQMGKHMQRMKGLDSLQRTKEATEGVMDSDVVKSRPVMAKALKKLSKRI